MAEDDNLDKYQYYYRGENVPEALERIFEGYERILDANPNIQFANAAIAGGACRSWAMGEVPRDIDMYLTQNKDRESILTDDDTAPVYHLGNAFSDEPIEVINFVYQDLESILNTFDFTVAMCAVDKEQLVCHKNYLADLASKSIVFTNLNKPMNSLLRLQKYVKYGFTAHPRELTLLAQAFYMSSQEPEMPDYARDPVTGHFVIQYKTGTANSPLPF